MKGFLIQNAQLGHLQAPERRDAENNRIVSFLVAVTPSTILPFNKGNPENEHLCHSLSQQLKRGGESMGLLLCELTKNAVEGVCFRVVSGPLTTTLVDLLGENARIHVSVTNLNILGDSDLAGFETSGMKIENGLYACLDRKLNYSFREDWPGYDVLESWLATDLTELPLLEFQGLITICVSDGIPVVTDNMQAFRKMLQEEIGSDLVIILENGKKVNAHKGVLGAHSDVFKAMFQSDMKEAKTSTLEIKDMSEEGLRALLAYLYCWDDSVPKVKPEVALELLQAGHLYEIPVLEAAMKNLLLAKPANWFDGDDVALRLFLLVKQLPKKDGDRLKMKAIKVMKINFENYKKSPTYAALFKEHPEIAMEICSYFAA